MLTKDEILMGRDKQYAADYTPEISANVDDLLMRMNLVRGKYGKPMSPSSGWRPPAVNAGTKGAAKASNHMLGNAVDIKDPNGDLARWVLENLDVIQEAGLWLEDFRWTKGWVHFQRVPPGSGKRIFIPYADVTKNPMNNPDIWDGTYDHKYDAAA